MRDAIWASPLSGHLPLLTACSLNGALRGDNGDLCFRTGHWMKSERARWLNSRKLMPTMWAPV